MLFDFFLWERDGVMDWHMPAGESNIAAAKLLVQLIE